MTKPNYCLSNSSHRVHTPTTRLLRCEVCGRTWPWGGMSGVGDRLPFHEVEENPVALEDLIAGRSV